jgi:hypothetical protein
LIQNQFFKKNKQLPEFDAKKQMFSAIA